MGFREGMKGQKGKGSGRDCAVYVRPSNGYRENISWALFS